MIESKPATQYSPRNTNSIAKDLTIFVGLVVDGVLDTNVLQRAAKELVRQWPSLGGLLNQKTSPWSFKSGDNVDFMSRTIHINLQNHFPVDFHITKSDIPTYHAQPSGNLADECFHFNSLRPLNLLPKDLLTIRVTSLSDATLIGFRVPHHFCDGESVYDIVKAYRDIIAGQQIKDLVLPPDIDTPLSKLLDQNTKSPLPIEAEPEHVPYLLPNEKLLVGIRPWIHYVGYALFKMLGAKVGLAQQSEEKFIHLPGPLVETWRNECQKELEYHLGKDNHEVHTISKMDIITAWFLQTSLSRVKPDNGPLDLIYNFSYRFALPVPKPNETYLKSTYYELRIHWDSLANFQTSTLATLARNIRTSVLHSKQLSIIKSNLEFQEQHATDLVAPGGENIRLAFLPFVSSWNTFDYNGLDFSAALVEGNDESTAQKGGKVVFTLPRVALPMGITVAPLAVVLKDGGGGYWLRANLSTTGWEGHGL